MNLEPGDRRRPDRGYQDPTPMRLKRRGVLGGVIDHAPDCLTPGSAIVHLLEFDNASSGVFPYLQYNGETVLAATYDVTLSGGTPASLSGKTITNKDTCTYVIVEWIDGVPEIVWAGC